MPPTKKTARKKRAPRRRTIDKARAPLREAPPAPSAGTGQPPLTVLEIGHGLFPQIQHLNPEFRPGVAKLKVTLRIASTAGLPEAGALLETLTGALPSLADHRCCGSRSLDQTLAARRPAPEMPETDGGVDLAHLVEHVIIDVQHFVARMQICSGVTCAYADPRDQYDVFVECANELVGRTCAIIAVSLISDLLDGLPPDPSYLCVMDLARLARDNPGLPVDPRAAALERTWGREQVRNAAAFLNRQGYLRRCETSFNFSGAPLLAFVPDPDSEAAFS